MNDMEGILIAHQRQNASSCLCGWSELGKSHAAHQAAALTAAGFGPTTQAKSKPEGRYTYRDAWAIQALPPVGKSIMVTCCICRIPVEVRPQGGMGVFPDRNDDMNAHLEWHNRLERRPNTLGGG